MPILDGIELITELKSLLSGAKTAIVLWSSIQATELKKSATASGADAFYSKAFSQKS
jgi:CheY-like chemotaxis protein